ncbi:MAG TPA: hypothetical protein VNU45_17890 [Rummeliibacillus sp.]|nr:hypothetical protein [Rummeliibacillus sp.]
MSNFQTLSLVSEGNTSTAPSIFIASTSDSFGTITAVGYLDDIAGDGILKPNDVIFINYSDLSTFPLNTGESAIFGEFNVSYTNPNWSLSVQSLDTVTSAAITAAQFNGMYAAPVLLIPAPGVNRLIVVDRMELIMTYGSTNFAAGGVVGAQYDSTINGAGIKATNTEAAADFFAAASTTFLFNGTTVLAPFATSVNKGLYLSNATGAFTTGNSTFVCKVHYHIVATA